MEPDFWRARWEANQIGFHKSEVNPLLVKHLPALNLAKGDRVFVPLCGKTLDIPWLLAEGYRVVGAELSFIAVEQLFAGMGVEPEVKRIGPLTRYSAENAAVFAGDIFDLTADVLGPIDGVYDRAALVALPGDMRARYAAHIAKITEQARQLLITFGYDQSEMNGPPFSVPQEEVERMYGAAYSTEILQSGPLAGGLKGKVEAKETIWRLG